jgi:hydroxymethylglutaryl-CoA reductase
MGINRQGKRDEVRKKLKEAKAHKKAFFEKLLELDRVAELLKDEEVTEDNLVEKVAVYSDIPVGSLEKLVLKGKLKLGLDEK